MPTVKPINLTEISPSGVGDYAICFLKLVYDSDFPATVEDTTYKPHRDFGTVCHYHAQEAMGVAPKKYTTEEFESARNHPKVPKRKDAFMKRIKKVITLANDTLQKLTPLPEGERWIAEHKAYDESLMPNRVGRKGGRGYGGSVDMLLSNNEILWDYKFTGSLPDKIKPTYLWQLASYHLTTGVPKTGILWTEVSGNGAAYLILDWSEPHMAFLANCVKGALELFSLPEFRKYAFPVEGSACFFCDHKHRCPIKKLPGIMNASFLEDDKPNFIDDMLNFASDDPVIPGPPPPPPVAASELKPTPPPPPPPPGGPIKDDWGIL